MHQGFAKKTKQGWLRAGYPKMQEKAFKEIVARLQNLCTFKTKWKLCLTLPKGAPEDQNQRCQIFKVFGLPQLLESICSQTESNAIACISIPLFFFHKRFAQGTNETAGEGKGMGSGPASRPSPAAASPPPAAASAPSPAAAPPPPRPPPPSASASEPGRRGSRQTTQP